MLVLENQSDRVRVADRTPYGYLVQGPFKRPVKRLERALALAGKAYGAGKRVECFEGYVVNPLWERFHAAPELLGLRKDIAFDWVLAFGLNSMTLELVLQPGHSDLPPEVDAILYCRPDAIPNLIADVTTLAELIEADLSRVPGIDEIVHNVSETDLDVTGKAAKKFEAEQRAKDRERLDILNRITELAFSHSLDWHDLGRTLITPDKRIFIIIRNTERYWGDDADWPGMSVALRERGLVVSEVVETYPEGTWHIPVFNIHGRKQVKGWRQRTSLLMHPDMQRHHEAEEARYKFCGARSNT